MRIITQPTPKRKRDAKKRARTILDPEKGLIMRSVRLPLAHAQSFAKCKQQRGLDSLVEVRGVRSTPEGVTAFVCWIPTNPDKQQRILDGFTQDRVQRAILQYDEFAFFQADDRPGWYWCIHDYGNGKPCGVYLVHPEHGCDIEGASGCPDMYFRGQFLRKKCKHYYALRLALGLDITVDGDATAPAARALLERAGHLPPRNLPPRPQFPRTPGFDFRKERERDFA
jgi:hypothetical protein